MQRRGGPSARAAAGAGEEAAAARGGHSRQPSGEKDGWARQPPGWDAPSAPGADQDGRDPAAQAAQLAAALKEPAEAGPAARLDAIFVICGGVDAEGRLEPWVRSRCKVAVALQREQRALAGPGEEEVPILSLGGGSYHRPPFVNQQGFSVHESSTASEYLQYLGASQASLLREWSSYDTLAQAFFARVNHAECAGWRRLAVVCSGYNLHRVRYVFERVFALRRGAAPNDPPYELRFLGAVDGAPAAPEAVAARERASARALKDALDGIRTLASFHEWFYTQHRAYAVCHHSGSTSEHEIEYHT